MQVDDFDSNMYESTFGQSQNNAYNEIDLYEALAPELTIPGKAGAASFVSDNNFVAF